MGPGKEKVDALEKRFDALGVRMTDIRVKFIKSGGRGGQKVNKSNSGVYVYHEKTRIGVKCQKSRSQHLNRFLALRRLVEKIEALKEAGHNLESARRGRPVTQTREEKRAEKIRRQKQRRKRKTRKKLGDKSKAEPGL